MVYSWENSTWTKVGWYSAFLGTFGNFQIFCLQIVLIENYDHDKNQTIVYIFFNGQDIILFNKHYVLLTIEVKWTVNRSSAKMPKKWGWECHYDCDFIMSKKYVINIAMVRGPKKVCLSKVSMFCHAWFIWIPSIVNLMVLIIQMKGVGFGCVQFVSCWII